MKKLFLTAVAIAGFACASQASLILSNSFSYPDGPLVTVSAGSPLGVWTTHSGTSGQIDVASGMITLTVPDSEDVSTVLTNAAFPTAISNGTIYASFDINVSVAPSTPVYFGHFRGIGTGDFRGRVFLNSGSSATKVQVGVVNGSSSAAVYVPIELDLNATYKVVIKFVDGGLATVWLDPNSEDNTANRAVGTDVASNTYAGAYYWCWRQTSSMGTFTLDNLMVGTTFADVALSGGAPSISPIPRQTIAANSTTGPLSFTVSDVETPVASLTVAGYSDNTALIPNNPANIAFAGTDANRTVTITPAAGQQGSANVAIVVTDSSSLMATSIVSVVVGAPTIASIATQTTPVGTPFAAVAISVNDTETPNALTVTATSSNPALIQDSKLTITGTGTSRSLQITPESGVTGISTITVTVSDGIQSASTTFTAAVSPKLGVILADKFDYPDGLLSAGSGYQWLTYSPASPSNDCFVASGKLLLAQTNSDDVHMFYSNGVSFAVNSGAVLYSKFTLNYSMLPSTSDGGYFAFFKEAGTSQFRARVFAQTNNAAAGKFRLAISNGGFSQQRYPMDLSLGTDYVVVTRFNTVSGIATLWVNPRSESSQSVSGIDYAPGTELFTYAFRQDGKGGTMGALSVDDLVVGTSFSDVLTELPPLTPIPLNIALSGSNVVLTWSDPAFKLQSADSLAGTWTTLDVSTGYTTPATGTKFYRLRSQ